MMATVQHVFLESGPPSSGRVAAVGAHYVDEDSGRLWMSLWTNGVDETEWVELQIKEPTLRISNTRQLALGSSLDAVVVGGGMIQISQSEGEIWSNVPGTIQSEFLTWEGPAHVSVRTIYDPIDSSPVGLHVAVNPVSELEPPE